MGYWNDIVVPAISGNLDETGKPTTEVYMLIPPEDPLEINPYLYKYASNGKEFVIQYYLETGGPTLKQIHEY